MNDDKLKIFQAILVETCEGKAKCTVCLNKRQTAIFYTWASQNDESTGAVFARGHQALKLVSQKHT